MRVASFFSLICMGLGSIGTAHADSRTPADWSGFYIGADVGATRSIAHTRTDAPATASSYFTFTDFDQVENAGDSAISQWGAFGGLHGGYGKQLGNLYFGIEAQVSALSLDDSRSETVAYLTAPADQFTLKQSVEADWLISLRPRLGWTQGQWLGYVTGGPAIARIKFDTTFSDTFSLDAHGHDSTSKTKFGWALGAGGEYALSNDWSVRGEFMHYDFGDVDTSALITNPSFAGLSNVIKSKADLEINTLSVGITYRFNAF